MTGNARTRKMQKPKPRPKRATPKKPIERFVLLVKPLSKVTVHRDIPWWPMTKGVCDTVTVRIEIDDEGDVLVDGWTAGLDKTQAVAKKYLRSAEGAWCAMQELARRNWHFVHVPAKEVAQNEGK